MKKNPNWTEEELKMAINVYCKIPFTKARKSSPEIIKWAKIIGRSPGGLYTKICNFGHCDSGVQAKGLSHTGKLDSIIWAEFERNPEKVIFESEQLLAQKMGKTLEEYTEIRTEDLPVGKTREIVVRQRVNQRFFHDTVLSAYNQHCCITGLSISTLLEACHISSWKDDVKNRTNPKNGLCMTPTFHRAYDKYLMAVTPDFEIVISEQMIEGTKDVKTQQYLIGLQHKKILLPDKFAPDVDLLAMHHELFLKSIS
ncbi:MAG: HNH endonuclease [Prevotella sp.]|nr:HNH endonuclease [Prevotella sp.]